MSDTVELKLHSLFVQSLSNENVVTIGTTVDTGFEWQAADECKEKLGENVKIVKERGKIYFNVEQEEFPKVQEMRSIDNIFVVGDVRIFKFAGINKETDLQPFKDAVHNDIQLQKSLNAWQRFTGFVGKIYPTRKEYDAAENIHKTRPKADTLIMHRGRKRGQDPAEADENDLLKYRVTCERTGTHAFESSDVARVVGGELQDKFLWLVDLTMYHLEIYCKLISNILITHLRVTHESKHRRNITAFGPTTLRATVCYNLLRLAQPSPGDIVIDPMCGGGSIPIEAALAYTQSYVLCGDNHPKAVIRAKSNIDTTMANCRTDLLYWSVTQLPFMNSSIDIIVTDMPFGKRSGRMTDNRVLYKKFLLQLGRVVRLSTGRMVLLTSDRRSMNMALQEAGDLFHVTKMVGVNIGGLQAAVYVLKRSNIEYEQFRPRIKNNA
ncbi:hypothetical protein KM043_000675 [Ampulex compressa]|nr:hypothetical protein KM043_000675 [Ampulex compressa]